MEYQKTIEWNWVSIKWWIETLHPFILTLEYHLTLLEDENHG